MKRIQLIDYLKGYSILTIVIFHYLQELGLTNPFDKIILFGGTGVHLFILLSGFGLYFSYLKRPVAYKEYLAKRFSKIYIPYILIVILSAVISLMIPIFSNSFYAFCGHVFLYKMFDNEIVGSYGFQLWFVSMIFQFYLTFYLIKYFKEKISNSVNFLLVGIFISFCWSLIVLFTDNQSSRVWNSFFLQYFWEFVLGMIFAQYFVNDKFHVNLKKIYYLILGFLFIIIYGLLALFGGDLGKLFNDIPALIGYSFIAIFIYQLKINIINDFISNVGQFSLSLYLVHIVILKVIFYYLTFIPSNFLILIAFVLTIFLSKMYQKFVNQIYIYLKL